MIKQDIRAIVNYLWADEKKHFEHWCCDDKGKIIKEIKAKDIENHIFSKLKRIKLWLNKK